MGIIIALVVGLVLGGTITKYWIGLNDSRIVNDIAEYEELLRKEGFDFRYILDKMRGMSVKAQATFCYQFVQAIKGNKRMLNTLERYVDTALIKNGQKPVKVKGRTL